MKKTTLFLFFFVVSVTTFGQDLSTTSKEDAPKTPKGINGSNEIRLNLLNSLLGSVDFQYERLLKDNSGIGVTVGVGYGDNDLDPFNPVFNISPAYRVYFSKKKAAGFFLEGSTRFSYDKTHSYYYYGSGYNNNEVEKDFNVGLGLALGGKVVTKQGLVGSFKGGLGRFLTERLSYADTVYPSFEIAIGKRF